MDLFHAITQSIDNVLTCDWYDSFKTFKMDDNKSDDKLMDTEPGGESTQYVAHLLSAACADLSDMNPSRPRLYPPRSNEARWEVCLFQNLSLPPSFASNVLAGDSSNSSDQPPADQERGEKTAENIRYGQNISESGMGGKTNSSIGSAGESEDTADTRKQQGLGEGSGVGG